MSTLELSHTIDLDGIAALARFRLDAESCGIFLVSSNNRDLIELAGSSTEFPKKRSTSVILPIRSGLRLGLTGHIASYFRKYSDRDTFILFGSDLRRCQYSKKQSSEHLGNKLCQSIFALALRDRRKSFLGFLKLENKKGFLSNGSHFSDEDAQLVHPFAERITRLLDHQSLLAEIGQMMRAMHGVRGLQITSNAVLNCAIRLLKADRGDLVIWNETNKLPLVESVAGGHARRMRLTGGALPKQSFLGALLRQRRDWRKSDDVRAERYYFRANGRVRSELAVRFKLEGERVGLLNVESFRKGFFDLQDVSTLRLLTRFAALAVTVASEESSYWETLAGMLEARPDKPTSDESAVFQQILRCVRDLYGFDAGLVYVWDTEKKRLQCRARLGCDQMPKEWGYDSNERSFAGYVYKTAEAQFSENPTKDPRVNQRGRRLFKIDSSLLGVPILISNEVLGVLVVWSRRELAVVTPEHTDRLEPFATLAAWKIALVRNDRALRHLVEDLPVNVLRKNSELRLTYANTQFCKTVGKKFQEMQGKTDLELFPEMAKKYRKDDREVIRTGQTLVKTEDHLLPDGRNVKVAVRKVRVHDEDGKPGILGVFWDVTDDVMRERMQQRQEQLLKIQDSIGQCNSLDSLFHYCVEVLPKEEPFRARYASLFTFSDTPPFAPKKYLVLRRTSFQRRRFQENSAAYIFNPKSKRLSLTEWVGTANQSLRLENMHDRRKLRIQLKQRDPRIRHKARIVDSVRHNTFLAVPISLSGTSGVSGTVLGVLRFTQKQSKKGFSAEEEALLNSIASNYIASKLSDLLHRELTEKLEKYHEIILDEFSAQISDRMNLNQAVKTTLRGVFAGDENTRSGKLFWLNRLCTGGKTFSRELLDSSNINLPRPHKGEKQLTGSITGHVVNNPRSGAVWIADFRAAGINSIDDAKPSIKCAIACKISYRDIVFGVVGVGSTDFDIDQRHHPMLLELLAAQIAQELVRRQFRPTFTHSLFRHDTLKPLQWACGWLTLGNELTGKDLGLTRSAVELTTRLAEAYTRTFVGPSEAFTPTKDVCHIYGIVKLAAEWARHLCPQNAENIAIDIDPNVYIRTDPQILTAILFNLLKNACRHGHRRDGKPGLVRISMEIVSGPCLEFYVSDMGTGIQKEDLDKYMNYDIVESLRGSWVPPEERTHTLGILYSSFLTKNWMVEERKGEIHYRHTFPRKQQGSTFIVRLPIAKDQNSSILTP